jgi:hypothetical protein
VLAVQVAQGPAEVQVTHVGGHIMHELLLLLAGLTEFPKQERHVAFSKYVFTEQVKHADTLFELHVIQTEEQERQLLFEFPEGLTVLLRQLRQLPADR